MIKKFIFCLLSFCVIIPVLVSASENSMAKIGDKYYDTLEEAIKNASSTDTIMLTSNVELDDTLNINKVVNLNLNGHNITAPSKVFEVQGGELNVSGQGIIKENDPYYGAILIKGSTNASDDDYSVVNVSKDVTLEGWSGIFIDHDENSAYGVVVNLDGKVNAVNDVDGGTGVGVYVNGNIKHQENAPVVNILDNAEIKSTGNGLYIAGNSVFNIGKAYISGDESGIGIKSGTLNIDGATVVCEGEDKTPTGGYNNGIKPSGVAIQIESNSGYAGNIKLNLSSGNFRSKNSNVIYEYIGKGDSSTIYSISASGGTYTSDAKKDVFVFSDSFKSIHSGFVSGGKYSSNPSSYLKSGYTTSVKNDMYTVLKSTLKDVFGNNNDSDSSSNNGSGGRIIIAFVLMLVLIIIAYINRKKLFGIFRD